MISAEQYRELEAKRMSERDYQWRVVTLARHLGWAEYHTFDSRKSQPGFPDLVLVRERVIYAEIKKQKGTVSDKQGEWLERLANAGQEVYVWRPSDYEDVQRILQ